MGVGPIATYIYINILQGMARSLWSGHISKVEFHCVGVIVGQCSKLSSMLILEGSGGILLRKENFEKDVRLNLRGF